MSHTQPHGSALFLTHSGLWGGTDRFWSVQISTPRAKVPPHHCSQSLHYLVDKACSTIPDCRGESRTVEVGGTSSGARWWHFQSIGLKGWKLKTGNRSNGQCRNWRCGGALLTCGERIFHHLPVGKRVAGTCMLAKITSTSWSHIALCKLNPQKKW